SSAKIIARNAVHVRHVLAAAGILHHHFWSFPKNAGDLPSGNGTLGLQATMYSWVNSWALPG
ncbi:MULTISPECIES: hypothetical protein, partial [unclassified Pseudomonas]|uniref:hypothetical protein n=1 Tax=unclassified Pseudomonas TaxID=196821 RepID=UPI001A928946